MLAFANRDTVKAVESIMYVLVSLSLSRSAKTASGDISARIFFMRCCFGRDPKYYNLTRKTTSGLVSVPSVGQRSMIGHARVSPLNAHHLFLICQET